MNNADDLNENSKFDRLHFRRQYLVGPNPYHPNQYWENSSLKHDLHLSVHQDLPYVIQQDENRLFALIGIAFNPFHSDHDERNILNSLVEKTSDILSLIEATTPLTGRWVVLYQDVNNSYFFTDPCGFRQVFYYSDGEKTWCGSQPEMIKQDHELTFNPDPDLFDFLNSRSFIMKQSAWVGSHTVYKDCYHVSPNHYLDLNTLSQVRFFPGIPLPERDPSLSVQLASTILKGTFASILNRFEVTLAVTSGMDSRILLAASKDYSSQIHYFVDCMGFLPVSHNDIRVPQKLAKKIGINFEVRNSSVDIPGWFMSLLSTNVTGARALPKTRSIYYKFSKNDDTLYINGNGIEICKNFFDRFCQIDPNDLEPEKMVCIMGYNDAPAFVLKEFAQWNKDLKLQSIDGINIIDMLCWEQWLGTWGAQYPAEQDISVEQVSPFNNRLLINTLMSVRRQERAAPKYSLFKQLIINLWPEVLVIPFKPKKKESLKTKIKNFLRPYLRKH